MTQLSEPPADDKPAEQRYWGEPIPPPPPGWYDDPYGGPTMRWWDGTQWINATSPSRPDARRRDRRRHTRIEKIVYGLAITAAALPILPLGGVGMCNAQRNVDSCQRGDDKAIIWIGSLAAGLAVAGFVIAIYALTRPNAHRRAMALMIGIFVLGYLLLIGMNYETARSTYSSLPSLNGYDTGPSLITTAAGLLAGLVVTAVHYRTAQSDSS